LAKSELWGEVAKFLAELLPNSGLLSVRNFDVFARVRNSPCFVAHFGPPDLPAVKISKVS